MQCKKCGYVLTGGDGTWFCERCIEVTDVAEGEHADNDVARRMQDSVDDQEACDLAQQYEPIRSRHMDEEPEDQG